MLIVQTSRHFLSPRLLTLDVRVVFCGYKFYVPGSRTLFTAKMGDEQLLEKIGINNEQSVSTKEVSELYML